MMHKDGEVLSYSDFFQRCNSNCSIGTYSSLMTAIPVALINMIKWMIKYSAVIPRRDAVNFPDTKCIKLLRWAVIKECFTLQAQRQWSLQHHQNKDTVSVILLYFQK